MCSRAENERINGMTNIVDRRDYDTCEFVHPHGQKCGGFRKDHTQYKYHPFTETLSPATPTEDPVKRARALISAAVAGPWYWGPADPERRLTVIEAATGDDALWGADDVRILTDGSARGEYSPDIDVMGPEAQLLAAAPELIARLCEEIERLRGYLKDAEHDLNAAVDEMNEMEAHR